MLVAIAVLGIWLGVIANRANRQRRAVEAIKKAGGTVYYDYQNTIGFRVEDDAPPPGPAWLRNLVGIDYLATTVGVTINTDIADDRFEVMDELPKLKTAFLSGKGVTDLTLAHLTGVQHLLGLYIFESSMTDSGWENLERMTHLTDLLLQGSNVNDATLSHIKGFTDLRTVSLVNSQITDAGLKQLKSLRQLERLVLNGNGNLTEDGKQELRRSLPQLDIDEGND
jgi:hypothetical protein